MPNIIDVILHTNKYFTQTFAVINESPKFLYERKGNCLVASDDGFYSTYFYDAPSKNWRAFAGRTFDIPMKDGTIIKANGQWWDGQHQQNAPEPIVDIGAATIKELEKCYVFCSGHTSKAKFDKWMAENEPSTDYWKYDLRRKLK